MELMLAIVVIAAVIFFGALISVGNERQRKALDELNESTKYWAMQDLQIKREQLARDVKIGDPKIWLNNLASKSFGYDLDLQFLECFDEPQSLVCTSTKSQSKFVFSPLSPAEVKRIRTNKHDRLGGSLTQNPLLNLPRNVKSHEFSVLNQGILFDQELTLVWRELTGQQLLSCARLWMFEYL